MDGWPLVIMSNNQHNISDKTELALESSHGLEHFFSVFARYGALLETRCTQLEAQIEALSLGHLASISKQSENLYKSEKFSGTVDLEPITPYLYDNGVDDILINGPNTVYVERQGTVFPTDVRFRDEAHLLAFIQSILSYSGLTLDPRHPLIDTRLPDGSRVNIIAPPLAVDGINVSIRKIGHSSYSLDTLAESGSMSKQVADFLKVCASVRLNMIISGGTGSGKTTLLNAIANHIRPSDRIVTIENPAELRLKLPNIVRLEWMDAYGKIALEPISSRDLVRNALRMRPDRIIVGEVRGGEAFDMLQAMNTGHEGSLTTIHANTPRDGMVRIENMVGMADLNLPPISIRRQIATSVNLVVQVSRMEDGSRRLTKISEIIGMESETLMMQDIFVFKQTGLDKSGNVQGQHLWTGIFPKHHELNRALRDAGMLTLVGGIKS